jgi:hypothetical protein
MARWLGGGKLEGHHLRVLREYHALYSFIVVVADEQKAYRQSCPTKRHVRGWVN